MVINKLAEALLKHFKIVIAINIVIFLIATSGIYNLEFNPSIRAYIDPLSSDYARLQSIEDDFNKQDNIIVLVSRESTSHFDKEDIRAIYTLTDLLWATPSSRRIESLTNYPFPVSDNGEIKSDSAFDSLESITQDSVNNFRESVKTKPLIQSLVNKDFNVTSIIVHLSLDDSMPSLSTEAMNYVLETLAKATLPDGLDIDIGGTVAVNESIKDAIIKDAILLVPSSTSLIVIVLILVLRVLSGAVLTTLILSATNMITIGLFGWFGTELTPGAGAVPTMITIIAVADSIHFLTTYYHEISHGKTKKAALTISFRINILPMLITSLTTALGLLCLNFSESPPYRIMGNMVAAGSIVAFILSVTLLPALLLVLPVPKNITRRESYTHFDIAARAGRLIVSRHGIFFIVFSLISLVLTLNIGKNEFNDNWEEYYDESFAIKSAINLQENRFHGAHFAEYVISTNSENGVVNVSVMEDIQELVGWLKLQPEVRYVSSITEVLNTVNALLNEDSSKSALPRDQSELSQLLLLYELSLPFGFDTQDLLSINKSQSKVSVNLGSLNSAEMIKFDNRVLAWVNNNTALKVGEGSGVDMIFAKTSHRNIHSIALGTLIGLLLISATLSIVFRSIKLGLISIVPNILPVGMAYGVWGMTMSHIDMAISMVAAMSLGIVVDDTIHFLSKYQYARGELGHPSDKAVIYAFSTVGFAMVVTSMILCAGFSLMIFSHFDPTWTMGVLLTLTILFALITDLFILPALLIWTEKSKVSVR